MNTSDTSLDNTVFIGQPGGDPIPLPFDDIISHHAAIRDAIADSMHVEHELEPDLKSLVAMQSFIYAFNAYKALGHLLPDLFHETGAVVLRQLWEVSLNLHWIALDPDDRAHAFCTFTLIENRKSIVKSGKGETELSEFDRATAAMQARFRFRDRKGKDQVHSDFAAKNVADRAQELGPAWRREYELVYHLTSMHAHGAPGAILQAIFTRQYSSPEIRERNSTALIAILAIRTMVRNIQLLMSMGLISYETTLRVQAADEAFETTMKSIRSAREDRPQTS
jgi:hypothetical protein